MISSLPMAMSPPGIERLERVSAFESPDQSSPDTEWTDVAIGEPDGLIGPRTRIAIRDFQASVGQIPDGFASSDVLDRLRQP